jgi:hypothetical protein
MPTNRKNESSVERWVRLVDDLRAAVPHVMGWLTSVDDFKEIRIKAREDGTCLAIAKGYGSDGGPIVAFGVGYDAVLALMALDATLQGGHWRKDKPWQPDKVSKEK